MKFSRFSMVLTGLLSFLSFLVIPVFLFYGFAVWLPEMISLSEQGYEPSIQEVMMTVGGLFTGLIALAGISLLLTVIFIVHCASDPSQSGGEKAAWILGLLFLSNLLFPFYWFYKIYIGMRPAPEQSPPISRAHSNRSDKRAPFL